VLLAINHIINYGEYIALFILIDYENVITE